MSILDRYIARQYLTNVAALLVIIASFVVVIDVSINLDDFVEAASTLGAPEGETNPPVRTGVLTFLVITDLWWPRLVQLFNFLLGLVLVAAMGFTCTQLSRQREFLAMLAAGVGLHRVALPLVGVAVLLTSVQALNQEILVPRIAPLLARTHDEAGQRGLGTSAVPLTPDGVGNLLRAQTFDADSETLSGVYIQQRDETGRAERIITAESATWTGSGWALVGGRARSLSGGTDSGAASAGRDMGAIEFVETSLGPTELKLNRFQTYRQALSFRQAGELASHSRRVAEQAGVEPDAGAIARLERIRWGRVSVMVSNLLSLLIVIPFYVTREPKNMALQSLRCAPVAIISLMGGVLAASAAVPGLPPAVGVFIGPMVLATIAIAVLSALKT
ncbi:MAG: LptF/LptG family permease [Planctomycetota bacterium]